MMPVPGVPFRIAKMIDALYPAIALGRIPFNYYIIYRLISCIEKMNIEISIQGICCQSIINIAVV